MSPAVPMDRTPQPDPDQPHLSHSRIQRYLTCPEQFRLHYLERLRPRHESANLVFGATLHLALAAFHRDGKDPAEVFAEEWEKLTGVELKYGSRDSWESLRDKGERLSEAFLDETGKIEEVFAVECRFELTVSSLPHPFIGFLDLVAQMGGRRTIVDFKTASAAYEPHEVALSDQLTAYWMADPMAEQVALCVLLKTKEPRIAWHWGERNPDRLQEYLEKVRIVAEEIDAGRFYKRPGKHCGWCDFLPVCLGDRKAVEETLVQIE